MLKKVCVVIPVYKPFEKLNQDEVISWRQCLAVLHSYDLYVMGGQQVIAEPYQRDAQQAGVSCQVKLFDAKYFSGITEYNALMLSYKLYAAFEAYEYMLLYQLDAFIFVDNLAAWCDKQYSYVGAPWFVGSIPEEATATLSQVGNGGFSLRRIPDCLRVLRTFKVAHSWSEVMKSNWEKGRFSRVAGRLLRFRNMFQTAKSLVVGNNTHWLLNDAAKYRWLYQEDHYWGVFCRERFSWYQVPTAQQALAFAFEIAPSIMYRMNNYQLPMGCHGWDKYETDFWKPYIDAASASHGLQNNAQNKK